MMMIIFLDSSTKNFMRLNFCTIIMFDPILHLQNQLKEQQQKKKPQWRITTKPKVELWNLKDQSKKCKWKLPSFYDDWVNTIQEWKCKYTIMMKFLGFKTFGHATSSLVIVFFFWRNFKMNLWFWRFSIVGSEKIKKKNCKIKLYWFLECSQIYWRIITNLHFIYG
jgi:hypothetical protein